MGYFSNGTENAMYVEKYCKRCAHWPEDEEAANQCAVMELHFLYNHSPEKKLLNILIPRKADGFNDQCRMFIERSAP